MLITLCFSQTKINYAIINILCTLLIYKDEDGSCDSGV